MTDMPIPPGNVLAGTGGPSPRRQQEIETLAELHTRLIDTHAGHDKLVEKAEPAFVGIARDFRSLHREQARRVAAMLSALGHDPAGDGSLFGAVNRAVVEVRSWFDEIGHNVMDALVQGEKHVLEAFDAAIAASPSPVRKSILEQMRGELVLLLDRHASARG